MPIPKLVVREYAAVLPANVVKHMDQISIEAVAGLDNALAERLVSRPATGQKQIFNIVWDPVNEELIFEVSVTAQP